MKPTPQMKNSLLKKILKIEQEIKRISSDTTYRKIRKNIDMINNRRIGGVNMTVPSPEDMSKRVQVRRYSDELKDILKRYEERQDEYKEKLNKLYLRRRELKKELFG